MSDLDPDPAASPALRLRWPLTARLARAALSHPALLLRAAKEEGAVWRDGRRLHPAMQALAALGERARPADAQPDPDARRAELRRLATLSSPVVQGVHAHDRTAPGPDGDVVVRCYRPHGALHPEPAVVYLHGGGWAAGDLVSHDPTCRLLAAASGCQVVSVDYRLAPEHRFPAALDDALAAYRWVLDHADELGVVPGAVAVMGDSAGGNLSAALCLEARRLGLPEPALQCLVYPAVECHFRTESCQTFARGFGLSLDDMHWFRDQYLPDEADWDDPRASPLLAEDLSGLPAAFVVTAGFDPLRDEGLAYADRLAEAGVPVLSRCYDDMIHGFHAALALPDALAAAEEIAVHVGRVLRGEVALAG